MLRREHEIVLLTLITAVVISLTPRSVVFASEASDGQGLVVFSRAESLKGKAIRFNIEQDGKPIGQLLSGNTLEVRVPPGSYGFSVRAPSLDGQDFLTIDVQAGWTYYVEGEILWGWPMGRPKFGPVSEAPGAARPAGTPTSSPQVASQSSHASPAALANATLGSVAGHSSSAGHQANRTAEERGRIGLRNFVGDWNLDMWSLASDGSKLQGKGFATGVAESNNATRIEITEFEAAAFPAATGGGRVQISLEQGKGFLLESHFRFSDEVLKFSGQYQPETGRYVFQQFIGSGGQTATGMARSSVRVEIRSLDIATWVADTYSSIDGQSLHVQAYRFTRP